MWGIIFTILGLIIAIAAGFLGYSAKNRAVYEAKKAANIASENHMQEWLKENKDKLFSETKTSLEGVSLELKERAEKLEVEAKAALDKIERDLIEQSKRIVTSNKDGKGLSKNNTSKIERSAQDWFREGLTAFSNHEYDDALNAWKNVLNLLDITKEPYLYATTMLNQSITYGKQDNPTDEINSYSMLIEQFKASDDEEIQVEVVRGMLNQGITYGQQDNLTDALNSYSMLIEQFKASNNEEIQIRVARAMINQGVTYGQQDNLIGALNSYSMLIEQFKASDNEEIQVQVAGARLNQGITYGRQDNSTGKLNSYSMLIEQFKASDNEEIQVRVARGMLNQGVTYGQQDNSTGALNSYSMLIEQFKASDNEDIQVEVIRGMLNQGITYGQQDNLTGALNSYSMLIEQFKESDNEEIQVEVARAMLSQGTTYGRQENFPAALQSHQELITLFKDTDREELKNILNDSLVNIAEIALLHETSEQVLHRVMEAEAASDNPQHAAIMQFIRFLLADRTIKEVFNALVKIPKEIKLSWQFSEIQDYLNTNFDCEKQQQIQAVVAFFEEHKDIEKLRDELGLRS